MSIKISRRTLLAAVGGTFALALLKKRELLDQFGKRSFKGNVFGANFKRGHKLIKKNFPAPTKTFHHPLVVIGAGASGLSAAYHLTKLGHRDIPLFELEDHPGGNSSSFEDKAPWGAHYLPLPNQENKSLISFLKDIGSITKEDSLGLHFNEYHICSAPMEKLFIYGRLQEGLLPQMGIPQEDLKQYKRFFNLMDNYKSKKGSDGKYAFNIPMEESSKDQEFLLLDKMTMKEFLLKEDLGSPSLHWYINYCCRDDYGTPLEKISAWAGIHYFSSRRGKGVNISSDSIMTWPEGNYSLIKSLRRKSSIVENFGTMLYKVEGKELFFYDYQKNISFKVVAEQAVLALPQFVLGRIFDFQSSFSYSPWMVANIRIKWDRDLEKNLAWDNVNYHGKGLGFVSANHQSLSQGLKENFLTYYWPLTHLPPNEARKWAIQRGHEDWSKDILEDLNPMIFDLEERLIEIQVWPWGHAMPRPTKDFLFSKRGQTLFNGTNHQVIAHSDMSGLSLFEEAFYRGEKAAKICHQRHLKGMS